MYIESAVFLRSLFAIQQPGEGNVWQLPKIDIGAFLVKLLFKYSIHSVNSIPRFQIDKFIRGSSMINLIAPTHGVGVIHMYSNMEIVAVTDKYQLR